MSIVNPGTKNYIEYVHLDRWDGKYHTGTLFSGIVAYYIRPGQSPVQITPVNGLITDAYTSGLFKEVSSTTMPGLYRFDIPDAVFASGANKATIVISGYDNNSSTQLDYDLGVVAQNNICTPSYKIISDLQGSDSAIDLIKGSTITIALQTVDANLAPIAIGGKTCSVKIYDLSNTLITTYSPTIQYDANGELTFQLSTTVSNTVGTYNVYLERTGLSETVSFGPIKLKIQNV